MTSMPNGTAVPNETETWLGLTEYAAKYQVNESTLRRRIKAEDIKFRLDDGNYFIIDEPMSAHQRVHRPSLESDLAQVGAHQENERALSSLPAKHDVADKSIMAKNEEPILHATNKLLTELKKAYTQVLHEKEKEILQLKNEVTDLNTLVQILESENDRLKELK